MLWPALRDPLASLRLEAAQALLAGATATEEPVRKLASAMGPANVDEAVQAAQSLRSVGVAEELVQRVAGRLEGERSETCPVCQQKIARAQRVEHLRSVHGYVELDGIVLPRPQLLARLWDKVFLEGSQSAHDQLLTLLDGAIVPEGDKQARRLLTLPPWKRPWLDSRGQAGRGRTTH